MGVLMPSLWDIRLHDFNNSNELSLKYCPAANGLERKAQINCSCEAKQKNQELRLPPSGHNVLLQFAFLHATAACLPPSQLHVTSSHHLVPGQRVGGDSASIGNAVRQEGGGSWKRRERRLITLNPRQHVQSNARNLGTQEASDGMSANSRTEWRMLGIQLHVRGETARCMQNQLNHWIKKMTKKTPRVTGSVRQGASPGLPTCTDSCNQPLTAFLILQHVLHSRGLTKKRIKHHKDCRLRSNLKGLHLQEKSSSHLQYCNAFQI